MKLTKIFGIVLSLHVGVILLVMFQPSCQTVEKKQPDEPTSNENSKVGAFNEGLTDDVQTDPPVAKPSSQLSEPTRPVAGELFVPGRNDEITPSPLPPVSNEGSALSEPFNLRPTDLSVYKIVKGDTLWGIARKNNVSLQALLSSNPSLSKNSRLNIGQEIMLPKAGTSSPAPAPSIIPQEVSAGSSYTVVAGDSLSRIARKNGVSLQDLMSVNGMNANSIIRPGQVLVVPEGSGTVAPSSSATVVPDGATAHVVKRGENLTRIASIYGTTVKQIMEWNNILDAGRIRVGQSLVVSASSSPISTSPLSNETIEDSQIIPATDESSGVEDFFKGGVEEKPVIDVPEQL